MNDNLGDRMKKYEYITRTHLIPRMPVIIRVDGKAFHTFTRGFKRPFDDILIKTMQETMKYLCENIQGCVLGYTQSDEITLVLVDYKRIDSNSWFDYNIQKCSSIAASMATMAFNKYLNVNIDQFVSNTLKKYQSLFLVGDDEEYYNALEKACSKGALFDARVFNIPKEEVCNCLYWRQLDATRNSIQMVAQSQFSHKELNKKTCNMLQEMLFSERGINWNDYAPHYKRGSCCIKQTTLTNSDNPVVRSKWVIDNNIPQFVGDNRDYINKLIYVGE